MGLEVGKAGWREESEALESYRPMTLICKSKRPQISTSAVISKRFHKSNPSDRRQN